MYQNYIFTEHQKYGVYKLDSAEGKQKAPIAFGDHHETPRTG